MKSNQTHKAGPVAVIAVHGVADQRKDETAAKAANLLLHLDGENPNDSSGVKYEGFKEEKIHVGVKPLDVSSVENQDAWHYQLKEHLKDYKGDGREVYETIRMVGDRVIRTSASVDPELDRKVHIYEMHWADVSNLKFGIFNLFAAIYRLFFETSWLGKQTIGKWASFGSDLGRFSTFTSLRGIMLVLHSTATAILTRFMPVMYILMLLMLALTAVPILETGWLNGVLAGLGGYSGLFTLTTMILLGGAVVVTSFSFWRKIPWPPVYLMVALICFIIWIVIIGLLHGKPGTWRAESGLAVNLWIGICLLVNAYVFPLLNRVFPGTRIIGNILLIFFTVGLFCGLSHESEWPMLMNGPLQGLRFGLALMPFAWIILSTAANLFLILAMLELFTLWFRRDLSKEVIQTRRSRLRTGVLSITIPVLVISFLNSTFFQLALIPAKLGCLDGVRPIPGRTVDFPFKDDLLHEAIHHHIEPIVSKWASIPDFQKWGSENIGPDAEFSTYARYASSKMVVPFLEATFLVVILVLGYSLWIVTPALWTERSQPEDLGEGNWEKLSIALGRNLTQGYNWMWLGQVVLVCCLILIQALFAFRGVRVRALKEGVPSTPVMVLVDQFLGLGDKNQLAVAAAAGTTVDSRMYRRPTSQHSHTHQTERRDSIRKTIEDMWFKGERGRKKSDSNAPAPRAVNQGPPPIVLNLLTEIAVFFNNGPLTSALGIFILVMGLGYIFFSRLTDPLVSGLRGGLDIALDVVSYLHPFPRNRTTRARIIGRYTSLLKFITEWRDPQNPELGYSRIVILTHSQGSVITSDVLRALASGTVAKDNGLDMLSSTKSPESPHGLPIRLFSMGSPLVQLYTARFPDLYAWDRKVDPRTNHQGLESWWNIYRSGDYVGRMIFRDYGDPTNYLPDFDFVMKGADGSNIPIRETCIGPGAHTHYWSERAPLSVVKKFDCLIACESTGELAYNANAEEKRMPS